MDEMILGFGLRWCLPLCPSDSMEFEYVAGGMVVHLSNRSSAWR